MQRGTRVGQAYVALTVDGDNINADIADAFDDVDYNEIGDRHGREYADRIRAHLDGLDKDFEGITKRFDRAIETDSALGQGVSRMLAKAFDDGRLDNLIEHVGRKAGVQWGGGFDHEVKRSVLDSLEGALQNAVRSGSVDLTRLVRGIDSGGGELDLFGPVLDDAVRNVEAAQKRMEDAVAASVAERVKQEKLGEQIISKMRTDYEKDFERLLAERDRADKERAKAEVDYNRMLAVAYKANEKFDLDRINRLQIMGRLQEQAIKLNEKFARGEIDGRGDRVSGNRRDRDLDLPDLFGSAFGKGSRNNVLNTLGNTISGMIKTVQGGVKFAQGFADGLKNAEQSASVIQRLMSGFSGGAQASGLAGTFSKLIASGPALVAGIGVVVVAMAALGSAISAVIALATALISTIVSGLVGALAVAAPALLAFVAAAGLLVAAFTSLTNAQSAYLSTAFQPIKAEITGIGQIIAQEFIRPLYNGQSAFQVWSANIQRALLPLAGVAQTTARSFAEAGNTITASLSGPGFQRFFAALSVELPTIVSGLSRALGGFLNGFAGMFAAILPYVSQFSNYLARVADEFSRWANSAKGQNAIRDFVDRAITSLKSLWGFLKEVGGFLSDVFFNPASQKAGNSIFDSLARTFEGFRRAFAKAARSGDLERWFSDAIEFGGKLWKVIQSLYGTFIALYNSGVLDAVGDAFIGLSNLINGVNTVITILADTFGGLYGVIGQIPNIFAPVFGPLATMAASIKQIGDAIRWVLDLMGIAGASVPSVAATASTITAGIPTAPGGFIGPWAPGTQGNPMPYIDLDSLINSGNDALNNTYVSAGGYMPDPVKGSKPSKPDLHFEFGQVESDWENPYTQFVSTMLQRAPQLADEIRKAAREAGKTIRQALDDVTKTFSDLLLDTGKSLASAALDASVSLDPNEIVSNFTSLIEQVGTQTADAVQRAYDSANETMRSARAAGQALIDQAQSARQSALQRLGSATTQKEADAAMEDLRRADKDMAIARQKARDLLEQAERAGDDMIAAANASQDKVNVARGILSAQSVFTLQNAINLANGIAVENATLADYAAARSDVAARLEAANQKLSEALSLRDNYNTQITDSIKSFGSILTAQAKTINGVAQALTFTDITDNLSDRLTRIKEFQNNLRLLLAQGLSADAYKQLVDAGVEQGGAYAQAILDGGQGAVSEVNNLTSQISNVAESLGGEASSFLYQAGVDAAQGLVDGLLSLSDDLESAATQLGTAIAQAIKDALGIASPSKVMYGLMYDNVGDGIVNGLDDAGAKVGVAATRLASRVAVSPEVAAYEARVAARAVDEDGNPVSGNGQRPIEIDLDIITPTEDPVAVANETINELVGRLP